MTPASANRASQGSSHGDHAAGDLIWRAATLTRQSSRDVELAITMNRRQRDGQPDHRILSSACPAEIGPSVNVHIAESPFER